MTDRKIDWSLIQPLSFPLKKMTAPSDIMDVFKTLGIKKYPYEIRCKNITIKYGCSDAQTTQPGERVYRQIGHLDSWGNTKIVGPNGEEFLDYNALYKSQYGEDMDHNDIVITVWPMDNYPFVTTNSWLEVNDAETELVDAFVKFHNEKPIGNISDTKKFSPKHAPIKTVFEGMFEENV